MCLSSLDEWTNGACNTDGRRTGRERLAAYRDCIGTHLLGLGMRVFSRSMVVMAERLAVLRGIAESTGFAVRPRRKYEVKHDERQGQSNHARSLHAG
jgi:hypothetical protein